MTSLVGKLMDPFISTLATMPGQTTFIFQKILSTFILKKFLSKPLSTLFAFRSLVLMVLPISFLLIHLSTNRHCLIYESKTNFHSITITLINDDGTFDYTTPKVKNISFNGYISTWILQIYQIYRLIFLHEY